MTPANRLSYDLQSIIACASDIQRWSLLTALDGSISADRRGDLIAAAERIIERAKRLPE